MASEVASSDAMEMARGVPAAPALALDNERTQDPDIQAELASFEASFRGLTDQFHLLDKVGEGTFSCVYKAIDKFASSPSEAMVAVKRIHATSSPARIRNELEILASLHSGANVSSVVTALRCRDQVLVVMPYYEFTDFRIMYMGCDLSEVRVYMAQLLESLAFTAERNVIHRDVKPTNFLYNRETQHGVLVDFGLAEFEVAKGDCVCQNHMAAPSTAPPAAIEGGYRKDDTRPARRANRAGTRGFRAPEVLLKCNRQSHKLDVWSAGVVMLMMLARRFPFFNSLDDGEALVEIATIYGRREMRAVAAQHGAVFETTLPTIGEHRHPWHQIVDWCNERQERRRTDRPRTEQLALDLLDRLMELDARKRPSARAALEHPFFHSSAE